MSTLDDNQLASPAAEAPVSADAEIRTANAKPEILPMNEQEAYAFLDSFAPLVRALPASPAPTPPVWDDHLSGLRALRASVELAVADKWPAGDVAPLVAARARLHAAQGHLNEACCNGLRAREGLKAAFLYRLQDDGLHDSVDAERVLMEVEATGVSPIDCFRRRLEEYALVTRVFLQDQVHAANKALVAAAVDVCRTAGRCLESAVVGYWQPDEDSSVAEEIGAILFLLVRLLALYVCGPCDARAFTKLAEAVKTYRRAQQTYQALLEQCSTTYNQLMDDSGSSGLRYSPAQLEPLLLATTAAGTSDVPPVAVSSPYLVSIKANVLATRTAVTTARAALTVEWADVMSRIRTMTFSATPYTLRRGFYTWVQVKHGVAMDKQLMDMLLCAYLAEVLAVSDMPGVLSAAREGAAERAVSSAAALAYRDDLTQYWHRWARVVQEAQLQVDAAEQFSLAVNGEPCANYPLLRALNSKLEGKKQALIEASSAVVRDFDEAVNRFSEALQKKAGGSVGSILVGSPSSWTVEALILYCEIMVGTFPPASKPALGSLTLGRATSGRRTIAGGRG